MSMLKVELNDRNSQRVGNLSRQTGRSPDALVNEAFDQFIAEAPRDEAGRFREWRQALLGVKAIWKDRDDLPDLRDLRADWEKRMQPVR